MPPSSRRPLRPRTLGCALILAAASVVHAGNPAADPGTRNDHGSTGGAGSSASAGGSLTAADVAPFQVFNDDVGAGRNDAYPAPVSVIPVPEPSAPTLATALGALALGLLMWPRLRRHA